MNKRHLQVVLVLVGLVATLTINRSFSANGAGTLPVNLIGSYDVTVESIGMNDDPYTEQPTMHITYQNGNTFRGYFQDPEDPSGDADGFTGALNGENISFAHCDSASFGSIHRRLTGELVIEVLNSGRDSDYSDYWSAVLIAVKIE